MYEFFDEPIDANEVQSAIDNSGPLPEGIYKAVLDGCTDGVTDAGKEYVEVTFKIADGPNEGREVKQKYFDPKTIDRYENETDERYESRLQRERARFAATCHRLGLLEKTGPRGKEKLTLVKGKRELKDCLGAVAWIKVTHNTYEKEGKKRTYAQLDYWGVLNEEEAKKELAKNGGTEPAKKPAGGKSTTTKTDKKESKPRDEDY